MSIIQDFSNFLSYTAEKQKKPEIAMDLMVIMV